MKGKAESSQLFDQLAKTAHQMVDHLHERAVKLEANATEQSKQTGEAAMAGFEREVTKLEQYIEQNPMAAAMVAFGIGAFASRAMRPTAKGPAAAVAAALAPKPAKTTKAKVSEAA